MTDPRSMRREKVEHILRAAGVVTKKNRFVLIGSAAVAAWRDDLPLDMVISRDVDLFAYDADDADEVADLLDGALGHASQFDQTHGYYCDGVGAETASLPDGWMMRAKEFSSPNTGGVTAIVPEPNDIALSKLCAWRPKDVGWLKVAAQHAIISVRTMRERLTAMPDKAGDKAELALRIDQLEAS